MKRNWLALAVMVLCPTVALFTAGCEGDDGDDYPPVDVNGTWQWSSQGGSAGTVTFTQIDNDVKGTFRMTGTPGKSGTVDGYINSNELKVYFLDVGGNQILFIRADVTGSSATGEWLVPGTHTGGKWTAKRM